MALVQHTMAAPREAVFAVLSNGWSYSDWVVGAAHVRAVDERWPQPGAVIHHETGPWPVSLHDRTVSLRCEPPSLLVVSPHLWPLGEAVVSIALEEAGPDRTVVALEEEFHRGPWRWLRSKLNDLALHYRNRESLRRLEDLAMRRTEPADGRTMRSAVAEMNCG